MPALTYQVCKFRLECYSAVSTTWQIYQKEDFKAKNFLNIKTEFLEDTHNLIRVVLIQSYSAGAGNFNYVFCHPQFSGVIQNIENCCAIRTKKKTRFQAKKGSEIND